ncbi:MAG: FkbM family methyltransferase [Lachnospiraceae bacterium]|nr:FkbM family methyltransferase [Lachnospiraceae bacterium]
MFEIRKKYVNSQIEKKEYIAEMYKKHQSLYQYSKLLPETNIKKIEIVDNKVYMTTRDLDIKLICKEFDERIVPIEMLNFGDYEPQETEMLSKILDIINAKTMVDAGANIGYISMYLGKKHQDMKVYSFEPLKPTFDMLKENVENNELKNINIFNFGLSNKEEDVYFYYYPEGCGNSSLENLSERNDVQKIMCKTKLLDSVYAELEEDSLDFIKCDVEGAEFMVFQGAHNVLTEKRPIVFAELLRKWAKKFDYVPNDVLDYMSKIGYKCYCIRDEKLVEVKGIDESTLETNFLFFDEEKHKKVIENLK